MTESHPILRQRAELVRVKSGQFPKQQLIIGGNGNFIGQWVELSAENVVNNLQISVVEQVDVDSWKNHLNTALESGFPVKHKSLNDLNFFGVVASVEPAWSLKLLRHKQDRSKVDLIIMYNHGYGDGTSSYCLVDAATEALSNVLQNALSSNKSQPIKSLSYSASKLPPSVFHSVFGNLMLIFFFEILFHFFSIRSFNTLSSWIYRMAHCHYCWFYFLVFPTIFDKRTHSWFAVDRSCSRTIFQFINGVHTT